MAGFGVGTWAPASEMRPLETDCLKMCKSVDSNILLILMFVSNKTIEQSPNSQEEVFTRLNICLYSLLLLFLACRPGDDQLRNGISARS